MVGIEFTCNQREVASWSEGASMPYKYTHTSKHSNFLYTYTLLQMRVRVGVRVRVRVGRNQAIGLIWKGAKKN